MPRSPLPRTLLLLVPLAVLLVAGPADAAWSDDLQEGLEAARSAGQTLRAEAERAIVLGGVFVYRHRHAVAGATLGCAAGATLGATTALSASLATGGASLASAGPAAALGCGLGALGGAAMGRELDRVYDIP